MFKSLQAIRAIAAVAVVLYHIGVTICKDSYFANEELRIPFLFGNAGVEYFFVLSGFIIASAHLNDIGRPEKVWSFLRKRFLRIFPSYWLVFVPVLFVAYLVPSLNSSIPQDELRVLYSLFLIPQDIAIVGGSGAPVITVAWTLQYELVFYCFFALLVVNIRLGVFVALCFAGLYGFGIVFGANRFPFPLSFLIKDYILLFAMGMGVAWIVSRDTPMAISYCDMLIAVGSFLFVLVAFDVVMRLDIFGDLKTLIYGLSGSAVILGLVLAEKSGKTYLGQSGFQLLGDSSYAIYLIHFPLISLLCKVAVAAHLQKFGLVGAVVTFILIFVSCLLVGVLFQLFLERPIAAYFRRSPA